MDPRNAKLHKYEVWAELGLCDRDQDRIQRFLVDECSLNRKAVIRKMHMTVYHSRRRIPSARNLVEPTSVFLFASETRFMVMAPGGENPRTDLHPNRSKVGIRVHRQSSARPRIDAFRKRLLDLETPSVIGRRSPSTQRRSAFGARHFQPHMTLLRSGSGIDSDLSSIGSRFRDSLGTLVFDRFSIKIVRVRE